MLKRSTILFLFLVLIFGTVASAKPIWVHSTSGDAPFSLTSLPDMTGDKVPELAVGYTSGLVACLDTMKEGKVILDVNLDGAILDLKVMQTKDAPKMVAATDKGFVFCVSVENKTQGQILWTYSGITNISELVILKDINGDGVDEVALGGADHRIHLLNGADGKEIWVRYFELMYSMVDCLGNAGDINGDNIEDIFVRTWFANHWGISGADGKDIWNPQRGGGPFLSTMCPAKDFNGDGVKDFLFSGNNGKLYLCSGKNGIQLWEAEGGRPVRSIAFLKTEEGENQFDCFYGAADGTVACVDGIFPGSGEIKWTENIGDVCRSIVAPADKTGTPYIVAGAENGMVASFSVKDGRRRWEWKGPDTVRTLLEVKDVDGDGASEIAAALLDGTVALLPGKPVDFTSGLQNPPTPWKPFERKKHEPAKKQIEEVPILLYHDIPPKELNPDESCPLQNFKDQMQLLAKEGFTPISLDELADWIEGKSNLPEKPVCITFDGQYASHLTHVSEVLQETGMFAISYITTDWIGTPNHLDWNQLRKLEELGTMEIENHSVNHPTFTGISREQITVQLVESKKAIYNHLNGKNSIHHTYPNGPNNRTAWEVLAESGFKTATSVFPRKAYRSDNIYNIPRYTIYETLSLSSFKNLMGIPDPDFPELPYKFVDTVGGQWSQPSFADVDGEGKVWICDYSAPAIRIFLPDGTESPFSPLTDGLNQKGEVVQVTMPAGVAITPSGEALVSIAARNVGLFKYDISDGKPFLGIDFNEPYTSGDVDVDAEGMIYVTDKLTEQWHLYDPKGKEVAGSPLGENTGFHVKRGISVTPDGSKVYTISETSNKVLVWERVKGSDPISYIPKDFLTNLTPQSGGVDVMDDGTVWVGHYEEGMVVAYDPKGKVIGKVWRPVIPEACAPRGIAFDSEGKTLWFISRLGQVLRWEKVE